MIVAVKLSTLGFIRLHLAQQTPSWMKPVTATEKNNEIEE